MCNIYDGGSNTSLFLQENNIHNNYAKSTTTISEVNSTINSVNDYIKSIATIDKKVVPRSVDFMPQNISLSDLRNDIKVNNNYISKYPMPLNDVQRYFSSDEILFISTH